MPLYRVQFNRTSTMTIYVEAADEHEAADHADILSETVGPDAWVVDFEDSDRAEQIEDVPAGERYWSGGEEGEWLPRL